MNNDIGLRPAWGKRSQFSLYAKQNKLGDIAEVESYSSSIRAAVFANFVPHQICFIVESPCFKQLQAMREHCIGTPQIDMPFVRYEVAYRKCRQLGS